MCPPHIFNGWLHSPHLICIRDQQRIGDAGILDRLGIANYRRLINKKPNGPYVVLFDAGDWTVVADSWYYNLWYLTQRPLAFESLAHDHELYVCFVGECDLAYGFEYYKNGLLRRKHLVESPKLDDQILTADLGEPLQAEADIWGRDIDDAIRIRLLEESLGIPLFVCDSQLRTYCVDQRDET